jgi:uncharacterized protein DUF4157
MFPRIYLALFCFCALTTSSAALACPKGQSSGRFGVCLPNASGSVGRGAEHLKKETLKQTERGAKVVGRGARHVVREVGSQAAGNLLAAWIQQSRDHALRGSRPIPPHIREALRGYVDDASLRIARYRVNDPGIVNVAHVTYGFDRGVEAVTLKEVIVFSNGRDAETNLALWAHELTHVRQYMDWGVRYFAIRYIRHHNAVEAPAYAKARGYAAWAAAHRRRH